MHSDSWAQKAKQIGYRSRAVFKLEEILQTIKKIKNIGNVLDLGAAPGGWSQFVKKKYPNSKVYAIDILDMEPIDGVNFFIDSIENISNIEPIHKLKGDFDLVISDIAPNLSGISAVDSENIFELNKLTIEVASSFLKTGGYLVMKTFQNSMLKSLRKDMELSFKIVQTYKPACIKKTIRRNISLWRNVIYE
jgi:23S rRNA (uridine2552-2'-O)-methyltransferase